MAVGHSIYSRTAAATAPQPAPSAAAPAAVANPEFLTTDELAEVTGYKHVASQREWLDKNAWSYVVNASGRPIVGRWFARMRLAGVQPTATGLQSAWRPDFSALE